jgi:hypothetical protein
MSGIALTSPISRGSDGAVDIMFVGANFSTGQVTVRLVYSPSAQLRDFIFAGPDLIALRQAVPNFAGLRTALLAYIQTLDPSLGGSVT